MKRAVILHATEQDSQGHWYQWLKRELEKRDYEVWVPDLPNSDHPNGVAYNQILLDKGWDFSDNLLIGHSSGAVQILNLLPRLSDNVIVQTAVFIGSFTPVLASEPDWLQLKDLFIDPLSFSEIKARTQHRLFVHGSDDPWCPLAGAKTLSRQADGELIVVPGGGHFSTSLDSKYREFSELINILEARQLL